MLCIVFGAVPEQVEVLDGQFRVRREGYFMTPENFILKPWDKGSLPPVYENSFLNMRPAPEYATGEVLLASLYRNVGFGQSVSEGGTSQRGRDFMRRIEKQRGRAATNSGELGVDSWEAIGVSVSIQPQATQPEQQQASSNLPIGTRRCSLFSFCASCQ
jgi:hypothetical protein